MRGRANRGESPGLASGNGGDYIFPRPIPVETRFSGLCPNCGGEIGAERLAAGLP
ncbi:MAG: hypothetical protein GXO72_03030, partial [Caldiserica bacterium]|nr:hypothetical protein [Caldisericota bacterium]